MKNNFLFCFLVQFLLSSAFVWGGQEQLWLNNGKELKKDEYKQGEILIGGEAFRPHHKDCPPYEDAQLVCDQNRKVVGLATFDHKFDDSRRRLTLENIVVYKFEGVFQGDKNKDFFLRFFSENSADGLRIYKISAPMPKQEKTVTIQQPSWFSWLNKRKILFTGLGLLVVALMHRVGAFKMLTK